MPYRNINASRNVTQMMPSKHKYLRYLRKLWDYFNIYRLSKLTFQNISIYITSSFPHPPVTYPNEIARLKDIWTSGNKWNAKAFKTPENFNIHKTYENTHYICTVLTAKGLTQTCVACVAWVEEGIKMNTFVWACLLAAEWCINNGWTHAMFIHEKFMEEVEIKEDGKR